MSTPNSHPIDRPPAILAAIAVSAIGALFYNVLPLFIGVAQDYRQLDDQSAGLLASGFFVGFTLVNASGFFWIRRWNWRRVALVALLVGILALLVTALVPGYTGLFLMTALAGSSLSALYGIGTAALADTRSPARWYGAKIAAEASVGTLLMLSLPLAVARWEFSGMVFGMAAAALILAPLALWLPAGGVPRVKPEPTAQNTNIGQDSSSSLLAIWCALATVLLFMGGATMLWAFMERFGNDAGYLAASLAQVLSLTLICAVIGSLAAMAAGNRVGLRLPLAIACLGLIIAATLIGLSTSLLSYAAGACLMTLSFGYGLPYAVTIAAELDPDGRFAVLSASAIGIGIAIAPALGGFLAQHYGYSGVLIAGAIVVLISLATGMLALNVGAPRHALRGDKDADWSPLV